MRAAELGDSAAQQYIPGLKSFILACLASLNMSAGADLTPESFERSWQFQTNVFIAQTGRDDTPIDKSGMAPSLLCESVETFEQVLNVYRDLDPGILESMREVVRLLLEMAEIDGFELPGVEEKIALLNGGTE